MIDFLKLVETYQEEGTRFVEITEKSDAVSQIESTCSHCWGAGRKIGSSGWVQLASPSKQHAKDTRTIFVCKGALVKGHPKIVA